MHDDTTLQDVYARFAKIWADGVPIVDVRALAAAIDAQGTSLSEIDDDWLRSLDEDWVQGRSDHPFRDDKLNRKYRHLLAG